MVVTRKLALKQLAKRLTSIGRKEVIIRARYVLRSFHASSLIAEPGAKVLESYSAGIDDMATVYIVEKDGCLYYLVHEPEVSNNLRRVYPVIMDHIVLRMKPADKMDEEDQYAFVKNVVLEAAEDIGVADIVGEEMRTLQYYIVRDLVGLGPLDVMWRDKLVEEIYFNAPREPVWIHHSRFDRNLASNVFFQTEAEANRFIQRIAARARRPISIADPILNARLGRNRVWAALAEVALKGPTLVIRKHPEKPLTVTFLVKNKMLTPLMLAYLWLCLENKVLIFIVGEMASGKTTLLNALLGFLPDWIKICTVEDTPELNIPHGNWTALVTRKSHGVMGRDVTLADLIAESLRTRADIIAVGEIRRPEEAYAFVQAAATGHGGAATFHAENPEDVKMRLATKPFDLGPSYMSLLKVIVHAARLAGVGRRVLDVWESIQRDGSVEFQELFKWDVLTDTWSPNDPEELVKKSINLKRIAERRGWNAGRVVEELERRRKFIEELVEDGVDDWNEIHRRINLFYTRR